MDPKLLKMPLKLCILFPPLSLLDALKCIILQKVSLSKKSICLLHVESNSRDAKKKKTNFPPKQRILLDISC